MDLGGDEFPITGNVQAHGILLCYQYMIKGIQVFDEAREGMDLKFFTIVKKKTVLKHSP